jgi:hypothetical protein
MRNSKTLAPLLVLALPLGACKDTAHGPESGGEDLVVARRSPQIEQNAADGTYLQKNANFFFQVWDESFTRRLDDLPDAGEAPADKRPYSGGYYAEQTGGTDVVMVGGKSPLTKYDEAFHEGRNKASAWERENHTTGPVWAGHCNGFAATAQRHPKEPSRSVVRNGVTFDPKDVKALLAEIHMNADYEFLGGNRCEAAGNTNQPSDRQNPEVMGECEDINPGTLHAAVANWIGRMRHTLVMDMFRGDEVWNYPLYKYEITNITKNISEAQARQYVTGGNGEYIFNPNAQKFAYVQMTLTYAQATKAETLGKLTPAAMNLTYVLELNAEGEIIGGEWVGRSVQEHPDFLWVALEPQTPNGTRYMGNPHLDSGEVIKIWAESVGYDPEAPPLDFKRPEREDSWGKWPGFEVTLDGNRQGAVFAGKPTALAIKRKEGLAGSGVELEIKLNGQALKSFTPEEGDDVRYAFEPGLGLNRLQFLWKKDGTQVEDQYLRFHVVR